MAEDPRTEIPEGAASSDVADSDLSIFDTYTRAEALRDGVLIDASNMAAEMGFTVPVALRHSVWTRYVALSLAAQAAGQDEPGRLWNILWMLRMAALRDRDARRCSFSVHVVTSSPTPDPVTLQAALGAGDKGEPVITIMLFDED